MRFVIVTGMSGAGKSTALNRLEDMGYFCVDNLPISLISKFAEMAYTPGSEIQRVALGVDVRSGEALGKLEDVLEGMAAASQKYEILFLDAADEVLVKRYKETRRTHPLALYLLQYPLQSVHLPLSHPSIPSQPVCPWSLNTMQSPDPWL